MNDQSGDTADRLDLGMMTRAKRKEMGLDINFLTTTEGCRKREAINVRSHRSKTAGMLFTYRPCGISLGHSECIHAETCTDFVLLLIELFGTTPGPDLLTGVAIDRSCDVHPYLRRIGKEGSEVCTYALSGMILLSEMQVCRFFDKNIRFVVDKFHIAGHKVGTTSFKYLSIIH